MSSPPPVTLAARFAAIILLLCRIVAAQIAGGRLAGSMIVRIVGRLSRLGARFARLDARLAAGRLRPPRPRRRTPRREPAPPATPADAQEAPLPRGHAWLVRLARPTSVGASQLQHLLADPQWAALLEAAPQAGRILRPLCRMLGVKLPQMLVLPRRPRPAPNPPRRSARSREAAPPAKPQTAPRRPKPPDAPRTGAWPLGG